MPDGSDPESGQDERSGHRCQLNAWQGGRAASARHGLGVRGTSRRARTGDDVEWVAANVATGEGLDRVVAGVDAGAARFLPAQARGGYDEAARHWFAARGGGGRLLSIPMSRVGAAMRGSQA